MRLFKLTLSLMLAMLTTLALFSCKPKEPSVPLNERIQHKTADEGVVRKMDTPNPYTVSSGVAVITDINVAAATVSVMYYDYEEIEGAHGLNRYKMESSGKKLTDIQITDASKLSMNGIFTAQRLPGAAEDTSVNSTYFFEHAADLYTDGKTPLYFNVKVRNSILMTADIWWEFYFEG